MNYKNILLGIGLIIIGLLWFYFSFSKYRKLKRKNYRVNKEEAWDWPYVDNFEELNDYSMRGSHVKGIIASSLISLLGIFKILHELKFLFE